MDVLVMTEKWFLEKDDYSYWLFKRNQFLEEKEKHFDGIVDQMQEHIHKLECRIHELELIIEEKDEALAKMWWRCQFPTKPINEDWRPKIFWL